MKQGTSTGQTNTEQLHDWFAKKVPAEWFDGEAEVTSDADEVLIVGRLPDGGDPKAFREESRDARVGIAAEAERRFGRKVSWGVRVGDERHLFTHLGVPVMTRLRLPERRLLDTLVESGVARSRSDALAWCVRLVGEHEATWLDDLREALVQVQKVRTEGPGSRA